MDPVRLDRLIARHLDGLSVAAEHAELDAVLRSSPEAARRFAKQARVDADLRTALRITGRATDPAGSISQRIAAADRSAAMRSARRFRPSRRRPAWRLLPLTASVMLATGVLAWYASGTRAPAAPFTSAGQDQPAGASLAGVVEIAGGGTITLAAGSLASTAGTAAEPVLRLSSGAADCMVSPRTQGRFSIVTPHGTLSVVGTAFRVMVGDGTTLTVRQGTVEAVAGAERLAVGPGSIVRLGDSGPPRLIKPILHPARTAAADWNKNNSDVRVSAAGLGPTGHPAVRVAFIAGMTPWASCTWPAGVDWRDADGVSLVMQGTGSGRRLRFEVMDDGPERLANGRDGYERFIVDFTDDLVGWHERRIPFANFTRRPNLWSGMPDNGFGRERIHGLSVIVTQVPSEYLLERIGTYRDR